MEEEVLGLLIICERDSELRGGGGGRRRRRQRGAQSVKLVVESHSHCHAIVAQLGASESGGTALADDRRRWWRNSLVRYFRKGIPQCKQGSAHTQCAYAVRSSTWGLGGDCSASTSHIA